MKKLVCLFVLWVIMMFPAHAHPGRTDSNGGHYNRSTGEHHYHHGYQAHQHENGVCPYEADASSESVFIEVQPDNNAISPAFILIPIIIALLVKMLI